LRRALGRWKFPLDDLVLEGHVPRAEPAHADRDPDQERDDAEASEAADAAPLEERPSSAL
jgi:hypothetical protein